MRPTEDPHKGAVLLPLARAAITAELGRPQGVDDSAPWLREYGACFVTLTQGGELRGCIGKLEAHRPLREDLRANALAAAFRDPRFTPLSARELDRTELEVSLLSPMQALDFASEAHALAQLRPGVDGLVFAYGGRRSTFLPQVWEQLPAVDDFMAHLKRKAGLPANFWHAEVRLQRYTVSKWKRVSSRSRIEMGARENFEPDAYPARWWHAIEDGRLQCDLCPRDCKLHEGQRGACFVRMREGDRMLLTTWGRSSGFCIDPIEKKPLNHYFPGSSVLSFGTAGCNLACKFCQNWDISKSRDMDRLMDQASPEAIAQAAAEAGCQSVAFTYNDPVIFAEYAMDVADACHARGIETVAVTAGYMHDAPRRAFYAKMDAANVDLKAFTDDFYYKLTGAHLQPVLDTLVYLKHETKVWFEITTLLIPGHNDSDAELAAMSAWIMRELGPDVPLHFTAFHPDHKMPDVQSTPASTLIRARRIAMDHGLRYVYTGNVRNAEGDTTFCPSCRQPLIERDWHRIANYRLTANGHCPHCDTVIAGRFAAQAGNFGRRRIPIAIGA